MKLLGKTVRRQPVDRFAVLWKTKKKKPTDYHVNLAEGVLDLISVSSVCYLDECRQQ